MSVTLFAEFHWLPADYWHMQIPLYLYLAALAGGGYLAGSSAVALRSGEAPVHDEIARWGFLVAVVGTAGAGLAVLSHLAVIYRAILFPIYLTNFNSWITIGTWILVLLAIVSVISLLLELFGQRAASAEGASLWPRVIVAKLGIIDALDRFVDRARPPRIVGAAMYAIGSLLAVATLYTGFELAIVETVPLWNEPVLLPILFLSSGLAAGIGLTLAVTLAFERTLDSTFGGYAVAVGVLSGVSLLVAGYGWQQLASSEAPAAAASHAHLTDGLLGVGVWLVVVGFALAIVAGIGVGLAVATGRLSDRLERLGRPVLIGSFALLVIGSLLLRILLLLAAEQNPVVVAI